MPKVVSSVFSNLLFEIGNLALIIIIAAVHGASTLSSGIVGLEVANLLLGHFQHLFECIAILFETFALALFLRILLCVIFLIYNVYNCFYLH